MDSTRKRKPPRRKNHHHMPGAVAAAYVLLGALWIVTSDTVLDWVATGRIEVVRYQTWKGWFFILVTGIVLYLILASAWRRARATKTQLDLALSSAGGGIWDRDLVEGTIFVSPHLKTLLALPPDRDFTTPEEWRKLIHPDDLDAVRANTRRALMDAQFEPFVHYRIRHGDGSYRWIQSRGHVLRNRRNQPIRMVGVVLDITQQVEGRASVHQQVTYDAMTGLLNRETFGVKLARLLEEKRENPVDEKDAATVIRLSLRQFGDVNNAYGFTIGDQILRRFGRRLIETAGSSALVGRIAGDEFAIALPSTASTPGADRSIDRIAESGHEPMRLEGSDIHLNPAIGVAFHPADGDTAETLLSAAGLALQRARETPELPVCHYAERVDSAYRRRLERGSELREAARHDQFAVHYQPVISLGDGLTVGYEALVRWNHPREGLLSPAEFIVLAERLGLIHEIGETVLRKGCGECFRWSNSPGMFFLAVNLSPRQLMRPELADDVSRILQETGWPADRLELEVTETAITDDFIAASERLRALRDRGVRIAIDDFGTGYSTLTSLLRLPVSKIKIDRAFVARYGEDREATAIVDTVIQLANRLDLDTTAEGIETVDQMEGLSAAGCRSAQGYLFSRPVPAEEARSLLSRHWPAAAR